MAKEEDKKLNDSRKLKIVEFQEIYRDLIRVLGEKIEETLQGIAQRSSVINYEHRCTGDGLTWIVNEIIAAKEKMPQDQLQEVIDRFIESQVLVPGEWKPIKEEEAKGNSAKAILMKTVLEQVELYKEI